MQHLTEKMISTRVTGHSLVGVGRERPVSWGNYCWVEDDIRILNMWAENISEANVRFGLNGQMKALVTDDGYAIVIDERIPKEWRYDKLCFTGSGYPKSKEALKEMYDYLGDPTYEYEQVIDPKSYYAKRGAEYSDKGIITIKVNAKTRQLKNDYTVEYK